MRTKLFVMAGATLASALFGGAAALAHHAFAAEFDANKPVNLRGERMVGKRGRASEQCARKRRTGHHKQLRPHG